GGAPDGSCLTTLPVELAAFTGRGVDRGNLLEWRTVSEGAATHFVVERSSDGTYFESIGAVETAGDMNTGSGYEFVDETVTGDAHYRLRMVEPGFSDVLSEVIFLARGDRGFAVSSVYPHPVQHQMHVDLGLEQAAEVEFTVVDLWGRSVMQQIKSCTAGPQTIDIETAQLAAGTYVLIVRNGLDEVRKRFVVQR
ncbi:MAG: T9SS type A sorting domain-containing protein, partial [Bacteroidota bacterium]